MTNFALYFRVCVTVAIALVGGIGTTPAAQGQTWYNNEPGVRVDVVPAEESLSINVIARAVSAAQVIEKIASKTNMDVIVVDDASIELLFLNGVSPTQAIGEVAAAAGLSSKLVGRTYIIRKSAQKPEKIKALELSFRDMPIKELLNLLQQHFALNVEVSPDVKGELVLINLTGCTPEQAVEKIAEAAQLSLVLTEENVYRVGFADAPAN